MLSRTVASGFSRSVALVHDFVLPAASQQLRTFGHGSNMHDNDPEQLEKAKHESLNKTIPTAHTPGAPGWHEKLASDSEAAVKADKEKNLSVEEMQDFSVKRVVKEHHPEQADKLGAKKSA